MNNFPEDPSAKRIKGAIYFRQDIKRRLFGRVTNVDVRRLLVVTLKDGKRIVYDLKDDMEFIQCEDKVL